MTGRDRPTLARTSGLLVLAGVLSAGLGSHAVAAQPAAFSAAVQIAQGAQAPMEMTYSFADGRTRIDMPDVSIVWSGGAEGRMLMIQHPQKRYMEWGPEQLKMMRQMMGRMPGMTPPHAPEAPNGDVTFETTGARDTIGAWDAFEVRFHGTQGDGTVWLTGAADVGLFEIASQMANLAGTLNVPMGLRRRNNPQQLIMAYARYARAQGLPDGRAVRVISTKDDQTTTMTLVSIQPGPPPPGTFDPPSGYQKMQMPALPGPR